MADYHLCKNVNWANVCTEYVVVSIPEQQPQLRLLTNQEMAAFIGAFALVFTVIRGFKFIGVALSIIK